MKLKIVAIALLLFVAAASASAQQPRLIIRLRIDQVDHVFRHARAARPGGGFYTGREVVGSWNWALIRIAAIRIDYISRGRPTLNLVVSNNGHTYFTGRQFREGATIGLHPGTYQLHHLCTILTHEMGHWLGNLGGRVDAGWHTWDPRDLMYRGGGGARNVFLKYVPQRQQYYGMSLRELIWIRTRYGTPLVPT